MSGPAMTPTEREHLVATLACYAIERGRAMVHRRHASALEAQLVEIAKIAAPVVGGAVRICRRDVGRGFEHFTVEIE